MLQQKATGQTGHQVDLAVEVSAMLTFDAAAAVRGIVFHLLDEKLAKDVAAETIRRTVDRLAAKAFSPSIARNRWRRMTNPQRLEWLLTESQTLTVVGGDDVVVLRARRSR